MKNNNLRYLKYLNLSQNKLDTLPDNIGKLDSLVLLSIDGNDLTGLPETIKDLKFLERLYMDDNNFEEIPDFLGDIETLKEMTVDDTQAELLSERLKDKLRQRDVILAAIKLKSIIRQWTTPDLYDSKNRYRITLYSDNSWSCTCLHQEFKSFLKLKTDCEHIIKFKCFHSHSEMILSNI